MTCSFKAIHQLHAFSNTISSTVVQQLKDFNRCIAPCDPSQYSCATFKHCLR